MTYMSHMLLLLCVFLQMRYNLRNFQGVSLQIKKSFRYWLSFAFWHLLLSISSAKNLVLKEKLPQAFMQIEWMENDF